MYIILVGKSGGARKGTAMGIGRDIMKDVQGISMVAESITRERLIQKLEESNRPFSIDGSSQMKVQSAMTCFSPELSVFLGQQDIKFLADLTDFYDSADDWKYETKNRGDQHIHGICFNFLGATAPDWLQSMLPKEAIGGGFTSRVVFIFEEAKAQSVPSEPYHDWHIQRREALINDLNIISNLVGEYTFSDEARRAYEQWYVAEDKKYVRGDYPVDDPRFVGYCERRATHVRKLTVIMSASTRNSLIVELDDFTRALELLKSAEVKMAKSFGGLGRSTYSEAVEMILDYLIVTKKCTRKALMRQFYRDIDPATLTVVEEVLTQMDVVKITLAERGDKIYELKA
ncbi:MAG: DUF3987 domain-containing protein [Flavobacteriales bacterium]|nr:DUF3987 domain-containing protein [Flavobacteriales bacterium]